MEGAFGNERALPLCRGGQWSFAPSGKIRSDGASTLHQGTLNAILDALKTLRLVLFVGTLSFSGLARAEEAVAPNDPDDSERSQFTEENLPKDEKYPAGVSEIDDVARRLGFNYARVTRRAARGDEKALKQFFAMAKEVDGAAAESYSGMPTVVYHLLGDAKFAKFLNGQSMAYRIMVRNSVASKTAHGDLGDVIVIRIDASLIDSHSDKECAAGNFRGGYGFHPLLAFCDNTGELLAVIPPRATPAPTRPAITSRSSTPRSPPSRRSGARIC